MNQGIRSWASTRLPGVVLVLLAALSVPGAARPAGHADLLRIDGAIGPATADYVTRGLRRAGTDGAELVILELDTPGGLDTSMRKIVKAILGSPLPVVGYVAPSGSRAASAGTYIMYATHIAAMAPATNLGAATPVQLMGGESSPAPAAGDNEPGGADKKSSGKAAPAGTAEERKALNDAIAYIRGLAEKRGRNADWAEHAVREAASLPAETALQQHVIDLIAPDVEALLTKIDGRSVETAAGKVTLHTGGLAVQPVEPDWRTRFLAVITNPNVAYILMLIGIYGLLFEGYNPGAVLPGVAGGISLLLALYAFQILPVNYAGLALILLGVILMVAETFVASFGTLGIGGIIAFAVGSVMLMDTDIPGFQVSLGIIAGLSVLAGIAVLGTIILAVRAHRKPVVTGGEFLAGSSAVAVTNFDAAGGGTVRVQSEIWNAHSDARITRGQRVKITGRDGLVLLVEPISADGLESDQ